MTPSSPFWRMPLTASNSGRPVQTAGKYADFGFGTKQIQVETSKHAQSRRRQRHVCKDQTSSRAKCSQPTSAPCRRRLCSHEELHRQPFPSRGCYHKTHAKVGRVESCLFRDRCADPPLALSPNQRSSYLKPVVSRTAQPRTEEASDTSRGLATSSIVCTPSQPSFSAQTEMFLPREECNDRLRWLTGIRAEPKISPAARLNA